MPHYGLFINAPLGAEAPTDEELAAHDGFPDQVASMGGKEVTGWGMLPASEARTIRAGHVTDGPFAEAKEVVAGFCIIEARDLDHAVAIARLNPATWRGSVEVRQLFM
jgi:hypothetical protein